MQSLKFDCGCQFPIGDDKKVTIDLDWDNLNYDCKATWKLIASGNTKGLFQIESNFCRQSCQAAPVNNVEDLAHIISIVRPGTSEATDPNDGKSLTHHYLERKAGREEVSYYHPSLEECLKDTQGILVYQEQAMRIARDLAGFSMTEADDLRKAAGKKKADLMAKIKVKFIAGCKVTGKVSEKEADDIWGWIEASQRYSFNRSHAISYAYLGYLTGYLKCHFPAAFFTSWLSYAGEKIDKQEEIQSLVSNARNMKFEVLKPDFRLLNRHFKLRDEVIYFGFNEVKGIGDAAFEKIVEAAKLLEAKIGPRDRWTYLDVLILFLPKINSSVAKAIINCGGLDYISTKRNRLSYELDCFTKLSPKEIEWVETNYKAYTDLVGVVRGLHDTFKFKVKARKPKVLEIINSLLKPPYSLEDTAGSIASEEKRLLGIALSCSPVDSCDTSEATHNCIDWTTTKVKNAALAVHIDNIKEFTIKRGNFAGKKMAKLVVSDSSGTLEVVSFTDTWTSYRNVLTTGNTVLLSGSRSNKDSNFIVNAAKQI